MGLGATVILIGSLILWVAHVLGKALNRGL
jgi:hypothetical protein